VNCRRTRSSECPREGKYPGQDPDGWYLRALSWFTRGDANFKRLLGRDRSLAVDHGFARLRATAAIGFAHAGMVDARFKILP